MIDTIDKQKSKPIDTIDKPMSIGWPIAFSFLLSGLGALMMYVPLIL